MLDLSRITIALERAGGWEGQLLDNIHFAIFLAVGCGRLPYPPWRFHIGGCWYGGRWWGLPASQN